MSDYTTNVTINQIMHRDINSVTGEITNEFTTNERVVRNNYLGPRKYLRMMSPYQTAILLLDSKVGSQLIFYIGENTGSQDYRITINNTHLAEDLGTSRETVSRNIKKLLAGNYLIKEGNRGKYFVNPDMFWISGVDHTEWQALKQEFKYNLTHRYNPSPKPTS